MVALCSAMTVVRRALNGVGGASSAAALALPLTCALSLPLRVRQCMTAFQDMAAFHEARAQEEEEEEEGSENGNGEEDEAQPAASAEASAGAEAAGAEAAGAEAAGAEAAAFVESGEAAEEKDDRPSSETPSFASLMAASQSRGEPNRASVSSVTSTAAYVLGELHQRACVTLKWTPKAHSPAAPFSSPPPPGTTSRSTRRSSSATHVSSYGRTFSGMLSPCSTRRTCRRTTPSISFR